MLNSRDNPAQDPARESPAAHDRPSPSPATAQAILNELASVFLNDAAFCPSSVDFANDGQVGAKPEEALPKHDNMYRVLVEQIPALVFIAYLERGVSEIDFTVLQVSLFFSIYVFFQVWNQINCRSLTPRERARRRDTSL